MGEYDEDTEKHLMLVMCVLDWDDTSGPSSPSGSSNSTGPSQHSNRQAALAFLQKMDEPSSKSNCFNLLTEMEIAMSEVSESDGDLDDELEGEHSGDSMDTALDLEQQILKPPPGPNHLNQKKC